MDYWINKRGFTLSGTNDPNVMLASNDRDRKYVLIRYYWINDEYRQITPIMRTAQDALSQLETVAA